MANESSSRGQHYVAVARAHTTEAQPPRKGRHNLNWPGRWNRWNENFPPRMSPWGLQWPTYDKPPQWNPDYTLAKLRGRWLSDPKAMQCVCHGGHSTCLGKIPKITLPSDWMLKAFAGGEELAFIDPDIHRADRAGEAYPPPKKRSNGQCMIAGLPTEIMQQILSYLVPTGCAYQFFVARRTDGLRPIMAIQQMQPLGTHSTVISAHLGLAGTNKMFNGLVSQMFYGENSFHFNIGLTTIEPSIGSADFKKWRSWSRTLDVTAHAPLGPLGQHSARYLRDVTLIVAPPMTLNSKETGALKRVMGEAVEVLAASTICQLRIHAQMSDRVNQLFDTVRVDKLEAYLCESTGKMRVEIRDPEVENPRRGNRLHSALEPLLRLRGCGNLVLSGLMSEEFTSQLQRVVVSNKGEEGDERNRASLREAWQD